MTLLTTTIRNCIYFVAAITEEAIITKSGSKVFIVFIGIMKNVVKKLGKIRNRIVRPTLFSPVSRGNFFCIEIHDTVGFGGRDNADPIKSFQRGESSSIDHDRRCVYNNGSNEIETRIQRQRCDIPRRFEYMFEALEVELRR